MDLKVLVSSPGDQELAAEHAITAVKELNEVLQPFGHSLKTINWQENISTGRGDRAQSVINEQIDDCDALIAIFGTRIGTPTGEYNSGTVEEILQFIDKRRASNVQFDVHIFFNSVFEGNALDIDAEQLKSVQDFRASLNERGINYGQFSSIGSLQQSIRLGLTNLIGRNKPIMRPNELDPLEEFDELGIDDAIEAYTEDVSQAKESIAKISTSMENTTEKLRVVNENKVDQKLFISRSASVMLESAVELAPLVLELREFLERGYANLNLAMSMAAEDLDLTEDEEDLRELKNAIIYSVSSMQGFVDSLRDTAATISTMPRRTKEFIKAKRALLAVYGDLIDAVEGSISDYTSFTDQEFLN